MVGDVHYLDVPELLQTFDVGWVPHGVEKGQVGGDVIKIYEYRAAGIPVLTTPIIGTRERPLEGVTVLDGEMHASMLASLERDGRRVPRQPLRIPHEITWQYKTKTILALLQHGAADRA
jgi:hypothetical protein